MRFVLLLLILPCSVLADAPFENSRMVKAGDILLHYRQWGAADDQSAGSILLVHGFGASTYSWQKVADSLYQRGYHVVAVDVPPFGYSDKRPRQNLSVTARAVLLRQLLDQEFPEIQWHLAGHSLGGVIVQAMALMWPEDFTALTLVSAPVFRNIRQGRMQAPLLLKVPGFTTLAGNLAERYFINPSRISSLLETAYGQQPDTGQVQAYLEPLRQPGTARAILNIPRFLEELTDLDASGLAVPARAIWGTDDTWVQLSGYRETLEELDIPVWRIEHAGHVPQETHFEAFMELFLQPCE